MKLQLVGVGQHILGLGHLAVHVIHEAVPLNIAAIIRFERRLCIFSFVRTLWFYLPVLVHHIVVELRAVGADQPHALAMSTLVIFSIGILLAEYPSGVFADWAGRKRALALSCVLHAAGISIYAVSSALPAMFAGQLVFGLGAAFRSGSDSSLLYSHLERAGTPERYSAALARMRIATNGALVVGCFGGGLLYAWWPTAVFIGAPVEHNGFLIGTTSLLSAISLTALAWLAASRRRQGAAVGLLLFTIPLALLATAIAYRAGWLWLGASFLITIAMGQALFRNLVNVRLQQLVPDAVRASMVSLESWIGSLLYVPVFPIGGALLDIGGIDDGYIAIAALVLLPSLLLCVLAQRYGVWKAETPSPQ